MKAMLEELFRPLHNDSRSCPLPGQGQQRRVLRVDCRLQGCVWSEWAQTQQHQRCFKLWILLLQQKNIKTFQANYYINYANELLIMSQSNQKIKNFFRKLCRTGNSQELRTKNTNEIKFKGKLLITLKSKLNETRKDSVKLERICKLLC